MEVSGSLMHRVLENTKMLIDKFSKFKMVFTLSSLFYCSIHWLVIHDVSIYVFSGALVVGAAVTMTVASLSAWFSSSPPP